MGDDEEKRAITEKYAAEDVEDHIEKTPRRVTHEAEEQMQLYSVPCWIEEARMRKLR